ncbi:protein FAM117B-like isoform X1 [Clytia hemisphaerica]|uniref:Uncharacterized protein n=1 Tax=Clytia hemisphaerica TaxID=252671 RepID=A0A7M5X5T6_9CNID
MAAQRPKKNNSPINVKHQPLKATVPLSSLVRNTSPTRRRTSPSSPGLPVDKRNKYRRSPDVNTNGESRNLFSPLGSKVNLFKPVASKGKNIRRTNSLETLSSSYINGQWPRESGSAQQQVSIGSGICRSTQTQWDSDSEENPLPPTTYEHRKPQTINGSSKEVFKQHLQRSKQQSSTHIQHGKQSPLQGDHSTFSQYYPTAYSQSKPVPIPQIPSSPKNPMHTRKSVEGLNIELAGLELEDKVADQVFARTPPDGHRPPVPGQYTPKSDVKNVDTQTVNSWMDVLGSLSPNNTRDKRSSSISSISPGFAISPAPTDNNTLSPNHDSSNNTSPTKPVSSLNLEPQTEDVSHAPKYASSPKPNNSFMFARGPPDGAEKVPLSLDEIESDAKEENRNSCPDKSKMNFQCSTNSAFSEILIQRCAKKVS